MYTSCLTHVDLMLIVANGWNFIALCFIFIHQPYLFNFFEFIEKDYLLFSEVNAGFFYKTADEREKLVKAERKFTDDKVQQVIDFKKKVCDATDKGFVIVNQKVCIHSLCTL